METITTKKILKHNEKFDLTFKKYCFTDAIFVNGCIIELKDKKTQKIKMDINWLV